jgi:sugar O-acyltransferase (sialic acid O-acetyltransferase NeuD family)
LSASRVASGKRRTVDDLILIGGGGHCRSCIEVIEAEGIWRIRGIVDIATRIGETVLGYRIIASDADLAALVGEDTAFLITIGQIGTAPRRVELFSYLYNANARLARVISPTAIVSRHAIILEGSIVMHHAVVNAGARVGRNCIVNTNALIEHDSVVEDHCHISTAAVVNGGATIRRGSFIGSNSMIREGVEIGADSIISAGERVMTSVGERAFVKSELPTVTRKK